MIMYYHVITILISYNECLKNLLHNNIDRNIIDRFNLYRLYFYEYEYQPLKVKDFLLFKN